MALSIEGWMSQEHRGEPTMTITGNHSDALDQLRAALPVVDPAALNHADRAALIELVAAAFTAAGAD